MPRAENLGFQGHWRQAALRVQDDHVDGSGARSEATAAGGIEPDLGSAEEGDFVDLTGWSTAVEREPLHEG